MQISRRFRMAAVVLAAAAVVASASCGSTESPTSSPVGTTVDVDQQLGATNKATGSPIKIGMVSDGKAMGIDQTAQNEAFRATVAYANEHLGGINGHVIEIASCETHNVPSEATNCGIQMVNEKVAAVLVPTTAQDAAVFSALKDSGIPYWAYAAAAPEIIASQTAFLLVNPIATLAAPAKIAKDNGLEKAAILIIDVPAATGPLKAIAEPIYRKAGIDLNVVPISPQTADKTPDIQQAIGAGAEQFTVIGSDEFNADAIKTLKQLGFPGRILMVTAPTQAIVDAVPGGLQDVIYITSATTDPDEPDVKLFDAVMTKYLPQDVEPNAQSAWSFALVLGFVKALEGNATAVDAATVTQALRTMPKAVPLPLGGGLVYQCGAGMVSFLPSACTDNALSTTLDEQGEGQEFTKLDVTQFMTLG